MKEQWRVTLEDPNYEVSDRGRVRRDGRILSPKVQVGYRHVNFSRQSKRAMHKVANLVASAFLGPRPEGMEVDHIDHDRGNDRLENLRYISVRENRRRRRTTRLTLSDAQDIRRRVAAGEPQKALAEEYGVAAPHVSQIVSHKKWKE